MYIPPFQGEESPEVGHRHYQHPNRDNSHYGPDIDNFPALAIYTTLIALATDPSIASLRTTEETLLFTTAGLSRPQRLRPVQPTVHIQRPPSQRSRQRPESGKPGTRKCSPHPRPSPPRSEDTTGTGQSPIADRSNPSVASKSSQDQPSKHSATGDSDTHRTDAPAVEEGNRPGQPEQGRRSTGTPRTEPEPSGAQICRTNRTGRHLEPGLPEPAGQHPHQVPKGHPESAKTPRPSWPS